MTTTCTDRDTFWQHLRQSRLLSAVQLRLAAAQLGHVDDASAVVRTLVKAGLLTGFQGKILLTGKQASFFFGPYRLLEQIGSGGMGRVYRARHETMDRIVALKLLSPDLMRTEKAQQFFAREVRAAAQLHHPNIVLAYDAGEIAGRHYLAMEYVDGLTLSQLVRRHGPLPVALACELIRQAALGLQHAHEHGVVHRDIKPGNLIVHRGTADRAGLVKILDFGMARLPAAEQTASADGSLMLAPDTVMGTPDYVSPEQARDVHAVDIRSDLYSLGCTLYYLLTGQVPFPGGSAVNKLLRHNQEEPAALETLRPDVPAAVAAVVRKLMAKRPEDRYDTPAAVAEALAPHAAPPAAGWAPGRSGEVALPPADAITDGLADTAPYTSAATAVDEPALPAKAGASRAALYAGLGLVAGVALSGVGFLVGAMLLR